MDKNKILKTAKQLHKKHGDIEGLLEHLHTKVIYADLGENVGGFNTTNFRINFIVINENVPRSERDFIILHELGHKVCRHKNNKLYLLQNTFAVCNRYEKEADFFATAYIMEKYQSDTINGLSINQISGLTGISEDNLTDYIDFIKGGV